MKQATGNRYSLWLLFGIFITLSSSSNIQCNDPDTIQAMKQEDHTAGNKRFVSRYYHNGTLVTEQTTAEGSLRFFYSNPLGKAFRHLFKKRWCSRLMGWYQNSFWTKRNIAPFVEKHKINMDDFERPIGEYRSFNDFFCRKLKPGARTIDDRAEVIVSPTDAKLFVFESIKPTMKFYVKTLPFNLETFLQDKQLAKTYEGGTMMIFRLAPYDYHRYHFPFDGVASPAQEIAGSYESVNPLAYASGVQPLTQNVRALITLNSDQFGDVLMIPVGAMCVGSIIHTYEGGQPHRKGDEAGYFSFGGSTIVFLFKKNTIRILKPFVEHSNQGFETSVTMGQAVAEKAV